MSTPTKGSVLHLTVAQVLDIHAKVIGEYGGILGVREMVLLESAVAAPRASFGGKPAYGDLIEVASAYQFFLCRNRPLVDGNRRTALGASIVFLRMNGLSPRIDNQSWENLVVDISSSKLDRMQAVQRLRELVEPQSN